MTQTKQISRGQDLDFTRASRQEKVVLASPPSYAIVPAVSTGPMTATTITVSEDLRRELLKIAAELQSSRLEKIDYEDVIRFLVRKATRNLDLFRQACSPTGRSSKYLKKSLRRARAEDKKREQSLKRNYS